MALDMNPLLITEQSVLDAGQTGGLGVYYPGFLPFPKDLAALCRRALATDTPSEQERRALDLLAGAEIDRYSAETGRQIGLLERMFLSTYIISNARRRLAALTDGTRKAELDAVAPWLEPG